MNPVAPAAMIRFGWETFKKRPWFFVFVFLVINILTGRFGYSTGGPGPDLRPTIVALLIAGVVVGVIVQTLAGLGQLNLLLKAHENVEAVSWWDLWHPHPFWRFFFTNLAYGLIVLAGLVLLIVPGIIWGIKYMFAPYIVVDRGAGVGDALKESGRITYGHKWQLLWLGLALLGLNMLGFLALLVGLLVTIPVSALSLAHAYRTLEHQASEIAPAA